MHITRIEMLNDKDLHSRVRNWVARLNLAAKSAEAKVFELAGPATLLVRNRRGSPSSFTFMGGEKMRISSVVIDRDMAADSLHISVIFTPVDLTLASQFASLTLPLSQAGDHFTEFEKWTEMSLIETEDKVKERKRVASVMSDIPTVEETRASETWGLW